MEVLFLLLFVLLIPAIAIAAVICIWAALFFDAGHFVDAAGGYSDVDTCRYVFRTGTCALRFVTSRTEAKTKNRDLADQIQEVLAPEVVGIGML
jgi:hypothetical protein